MKILISALALASFAYAASATTDDGKPWDWKGLTGLLEGNSAASGLCEEIGKNVGNPALKCAIDHTSWDALLAAQTQKKFSDRNHYITPENCIGSGFNYLRNYVNSGHIPGGNDNEAAAVTADMKAKLGTLNCTVEQADKDPYLSYDKASRTLTFHLTMKPLENTLWVGPELQKLKADFPAINTYWDDGHNM